MLLRELRLLEGQLRSAEIDVDRVLGERELGALIRTAFDPWARGEIGRRAGMHPDLRGPRPETAWPSATVESWASWQTDGTWHATFWVAEWPRLDVGADFLGPLLLHQTAQRTVALTMAPLPPSAGIREAESARTAQVADEQLRQRAGFLTTARRRREAEGVVRREAELSDGYAAYRYSGYVMLAVRGPSVRRSESAGQKGRSKPARQPHHGLAPRLHHGSSRTAQRGARSRIPRPPGGRCRRRRKSHGSSCDPCAAGSPSVER